MAFVVIEIYTCKQEDLDKLRDIIMKSLPLFDDIEGMIDINAYEGIEGTQVLGITSWQSKESFNNFLKSQKMMELLESDLMIEIQSLMSGYDIQMYNKMDVK